MSVCREVLVPSALMITSLRWQREPKIADVLAPCSEFVTLAILFCDFRSSTAIVFGRLFAFHRACFSLTCTAAVRLGLAGRGRIVPISVAS